MKAPAFSLYAADFYMDTVGWTCEEVGLYFRLLMAEWVNGPFQNDPIRLAKTCQISVKKFQVNFKNVLPKFTQNGGGYLQNERLEKSRNEHSHFIETQREKGKIRASKMWDGHIAVAKKRLQPEIQPEDSSSSSSSSSTSLKKQKNIFIKPTVEEVSDYCRERNNGIDAQAFIDHHINTNWHVGKAPGYPMKDWKTTVRTWERNNNKQTTPVATDTPELIEYRKKYAHYFKKDDNV